MKPVWTDYLHSLRKREIEYIFKKIPEKIFDKSLEIGAGDCYQSNLLLKYSNELISTEFPEEWLADKKNTQEIKYISCDAENISSYFPEKTFDFVFSSNVLEHLPNSSDALKGILKILKDDGISIHVVPSVFLKFNHLLMFYPNLIINIIERLFSLSYIKKKIASLKNHSNIDKQYELKNNPKIKNRSYSIFFPEPHGVSKNHIAELFAFRKRRWIKEFANAGFDIVAVKKGPVASGYGFGLNFFRKVIEKIGLTSEYIFIIKKNNCATKFKKFI